MKLLGTISVDVAGEDILARPGLFARMHQALGGKPDLRTGRRRAAIEATAVVDAIRDALLELGATNAVSLVVDDLVIFQDRERRADDLGDLFLAFHEHADAIGGSFHLLRLAIEHAEAGLHLVLEVQARTEHAVGEPAVRVVVSGRLSALEPRPSEDPDAYRARIEPLVNDRAGMQVAQLFFDNFVVRTRDAIARAMPEARVGVEACGAQIAAPPREGSRRSPRRPTDTDYDPHEAYYPNPMASVLGMAMLGSFMMMAPAMAFGAAAGAAAGSEPDADGGGGGGGDDAGGGAGGGAEDAGGLFDAEW